MNIMLNETAYMPIAEPDLVTMGLYIRRTDGLMYQQKNGCSDCRDGKKT